MQRNLIAILILLLIGGGATVFMLMRKGEEPGPASQPSGPHAEQGSESKPAAPIEVAKSSEVRSIREEVKPIETASASEAPQGVSGRVVDERGAPVKGASVWLMPAAGQDIFSVMLAKQRGVVYRPIAMSTSDDLGAFKVGLAKPQDHPDTQLRVVASGMNEGRIPNLKIQPGEWFDAGQVKLERGVVVLGIVKRAEGGGPIAGAEVSIKAQTLGMDLAVTPGRENGIVVKTDASGAYRCEDAPAGPVTITALAAGCSRVERAGIVLNKDTQNTHDFELAPGKSIAGTVVAADGSPIPSAVVTGIAISSKTPMQVEVRSGRDGRFELLGLVEGLYQLGAVAEGFSRAQPKPVDTAEPGETVITLEKLGMAQAKVYGKTGRLLSEYTLVVKTSAPGQDLFGNTNIPARHVRNPKDGIGVVEGLDPGSYVFQVEAGGHARAFSESFNIAVGQNPPLVTVRMNEGGVIEGVVFGRDGAPLPGASVSTLQGDLDESPVAKLFGGLVPCNITKATVNTDAQGKFRIAMLNEGKYHVKVAHPDHFDVRFRELEVHSGQTLTVPDVRMEAGTVVLGLVRVDGVPAGQIQVAVSAVVDPARPGVPFHCEAQTGSDGKFTLGRRLPPGRYQIVASRQTAENPFVRIMDYSKTKQEFDVGGAQNQYLVELQISSK